MTQSMVSDHTLREALSSPARPLPPGLRDEMESIFGVGLADVRLHCAPLPPAVAACATDNHVLLSLAARDLDTPRARCLLAHELTHVLQQRQAEVPGRGLVVEPALEAEADWVAACVDADGPSGQRAWARARPVLRRLACPTTGRGQAAVVQPRIIIQNGTGTAIYDTTRSRALFDSLAGLINGRYKGRPVTVRDEPVTNYLRSADYYRFDSMDALAAYMVQAVVNDRGDVSYADVAAPPANSPDPKLIFGEEHGSLHFGGRPTGNKSKWALDKIAACLLMEAEIMKHRVHIWRTTPLSGVAGLWYVSGVHRNCGSYKDSSREGALTDTFTIQAEVFIFQNEIRYHGYPDERVREIGCGMTRNGINANDEDDLARRGGRPTFDEAISDALRQLRS